MILSILIPSIPERHAKFTALYAECERQANGLPVEVLPYITKKRINGGPNIPKKRNTLYASAIGTYSVQIDDDDEIMEGYVESVLKAADRGYDCITYDIICDTGDLANIRLGHTQWLEHNPPLNGYRYTQHIYHKVPVATHICKLVKVNETMNWGEDADWGRRAMQQCKTEMHIPKALYKYNFPPTNADANTRY